MISIKHPYIQISYSALKESKFGALYLKTKDPERVFVSEEPRNLSKSVEGPKTKLQNCYNLQSGNEKFRELTCKASRNFCRSRGICWCANRQQGPLSSSQSAPTFWCCSLRHKLFFLVMLSLKNFFVL